MQVQIPEKLVPFANTPKRFKVMIGGRGGAKSESTAALHASMVHESGCRDVCCREFQTSIKQSVHSLMARKISQIGLDGFEVLDQEIRHANGGQIIYQGLSRDPQAIKSVDDAELAWVEEAQSLSQESLKELTPSIRGRDSEIWFTANLGSSKDPFSVRFIKPFEKHLRRYKWYEDDLHLIAWLNYDENPWFPPELEAERAKDEEILTEAEYRHKWLGDFNDTIENAIILPEWFDACVDAHKKLGITPRGVEVLAHDPSDTGFDAKGLAYRHGIVIKDCREEEHGDINDGADWALDYAEAVKPDVFVWDCDGMGIGLRRQFTQGFQGKATKLELFHGSSGVDNPNQLYDAGDTSATAQNSKTNAQTFKNRRAQYYWDLRDRCRMTYQAVKKGVYTAPEQLISFSSDISAMDVLRDEICHVPRKPNASGLLQIATKAEMASMGIDSPNMADAVMMSLVTTQLTPQRHVRRKVKRI